ncbi:site-specific integrase [Photobacterium sagamiensis]|uniref:site-specific integrase n=1 Tax=Photobacterium sagamiensis TaxID=2910241 RepID=UPI003D14E26B
MKIPNVFEFIRLPSGDKQRERIPTFDELQMIINVLPTDVQPIAEVAAETAMRRSEILGIELRYLDLKSRTVTLPDTKNGTKRVVPLSSKAIQVLSDVLKESKLYRGKLFSVSPYRVTQQFRKACDSIGLHDVVFHSLRHYAATSFLERGLEMMEVACITGHKDVRMLRRYTHISASHLANKLG